MSCYLYLHVKLLGISFHWTVSRHSKICRLPPSSLITTIFPFLLQWFFSLFLLPKKLFSMPIFQYSYCSERLFSLGQELRLMGLKDLLHILKLVFFIRSSHYFHLAGILKYIALIYFHLWNGTFLNHDPSESFHLSFLWSVTVSLVPERNFQSNSVI